VARYFNRNAEFWLNLQDFYDLELSRWSDAGSPIDRQVQPTTEVVSRWRLDELLRGGDFVDDGLGSGTRISGRQNWAAHHQKVGARFDCFGRSGGPGLIV